MSIHNILVPNNLDIFSRSINSENLNVENFGKQYEKELIIRLGDGTTEVARTLATFRRVGNIVMVNIKSFSYIIPSGQSPTYYITIDSGFIPEECLPEKNTLVPTVVRDDSSIPYSGTGETYVPGTVTFGPNGSMGFYCVNSIIEEDKIVQTSSGNFPVDVASGIHEINVLYMIN